MLRKPASIVTLAGALAVVAAMSVAVAPAAAERNEKTTETFENWVVTGSLTPKKLNEPVALPPGSTFNGGAVIEYEKNFENAVGTIHGNVAVPPFESSLKLLGLLPTTVGVTFTQVGEAQGTIASVPAADCTPETSQCAVVNVPTKVNIGLTVVGTLGVKVPTHCKTSEPITFPLTADLGILKLSIIGPEFSGTTTIPPITCEGLEGVVLGPALTAVMSGPENPYKIQITRPGITRPPAS